MSMGRQTVNLVECLAERSLAYGQGAAKGSNVKRLIWFGESQRLGPINEIAAGPTGRPAGHFRHGSDPAMDSHQASLVVSPAKNSLSEEKDTTSRRRCDIALWGIEQTWREAAAPGNVGKDQAPMKSISFRSLSPIARP